MISERRLKTKFQLSIVTIVRNRRNFSHCIILRLSVTCTVCFNDCMMVKIQNLRGCFITNNACAWNLQYDLYKESKSSTRRGELTVYLACVDGFKSINLFFVGFGMRTKSNR